MLRITRQTDYGIVLMAQLAADPEGVYTATELAEARGMPAPMVSKILKLLAREGLLVSHRGARGGYSLPRAPEAISVMEIIEALEGPVALTECVDHEAGECRFTDGCPTQGHWNRINQAVCDALAGISLTEMSSTPGGARKDGAPVRIHASAS